MNQVRKLLIVVTFAAFAVAPFEALAENEKPSGTIRFTTTSIGFIIGAEWGKGTLTLNNGKSYNIRVRMLRVGMAGIERVDATGTVYNLKKMHDFEGQYVSGSAGLTIGGGVAGEAMENSRKVVIKLTSTQIGLAAKIAASGITISVGAQQY